MEVVESPIHRETVTPCDQTVSTNESVQSNKHKQTERAIKIKKQNKTNK